MNITIAPELEAYVQSKIASGKFQSVDEVINSALRHDAEYEAWITDVNQKIAEGLDDIANGRVLTAEELKADMAEFKRQLNERKKAI